MQWHARGKSARGGRTWVLSGGADALLPSGIQRLLAHEDLTDRGQRKIRKRARGRFQSTAMASCWLRAPGCSSWKDTNMPGHGREILAEVADTDQRARPSTGYVDKSVARAGAGVGLAMKEAGIGPENVDYVNLHGTSTQLNDRIETRALKLVLGEQAKNVPMSRSSRRSASAGRVRAGGSSLRPLVAMQSGGFLQPST